MNAMTMLENRFSRPALLILTLCLLEAVALFNALPRINEAIWQDEALTLIDASKGGMIRPFTVYESPNNHVLFSSMMAGWFTLFPNGGDVSTLRLLPLSLFIAAVPVTFVAATRLGGPLCAILASLMFASSTVSSNFATQLRGYGPSWLFISLMFLCAMNSLNSRPIAWRIGYVLSCVAAIAMLPSNFFLALVVSAGVSLSFLLSPARRCAGARMGFAVLWAAPFLGLLVYSAVWRDLWRYAGVNFSSWTRLGLAQNWLQSTLSDIVLLLPLIVAGALVALFQLYAFWRGKGGKVPEAVLLSLCLLAGFAGILLTMPTVPFPRNLVPLLPVWFAVIAYLTVHAISQLLQREHLAKILTIVGVTSILMLANLPMSSCKSPSKGKGPYAYDLCYQYFRDEYHPDQVVEIWQMLGRKDVAIVANFEGLLAIGALDTFPQGLDVYEFRDYPAAGRPNPLIVVHEQADLARITNFLGLDQSRYRKVADSGYFKVYGHVNYGALE